MEDWFTPPANTFIWQNVKIVGVSFNNPDGVSRQKILSHMKKWEVVDIVQEPDNQHDPKAVAIIGGMGTIGYLEKEHSIIVSSMMTEGATVLAKLSGLYGGDDGKKYGAALELHFDLPEHLHYFDVKIVGINGVNEEEMERKWLAEDLKIGEEVFLRAEDDFESSERVFVEKLLDGDFGRLGAKNARIIHPLLAGFQHDYIAIVSDNFTSGLKISICFWEN